MPIQRSTLGILSIFETFPICRNSGSDDHMGRDNFHTTRTSSASMPAVRHLHHISYRLPMWLLEGETFRGCSTLPTHLFISSVGVVIRWLISTFLGFISVESAFNPTGHCNERENGWRTRGACSKLKWSQVLCTYTHNKWSIHLQSGFVSCFILFTHFLTFFVLYSCSFSQ